VVGMLPAGLQLTTLYSAAVTASARQAEAAMSLIRVLTVPTAAPIFKAAGLDPAR
jgi:ABC-type molybdate transport system substrate-binding protein